MNCIDLELREFHSMANSEHRCMMTISGYIFVSLFCNLISVPHLSFKLSSLPFVDIQIVTSAYFILS